ncbi:MAG: exopolysaccharide biosynthesis polyprenyl glycosylphosphotransferase [Chlamydiales bacterium]|nr:exopolysaccharide biosynthesis polyprenyl glycosylphosphotransferase [Chlamydiales bacterium]
MLHSPTMTMKKWIPFLIGVELFLIYLGAVVCSIPLIASFLGTMFIYLMTGGTLFYALFFDEMTPRKMLRKQGRRWAVLALLAAFKIPIWLALSFFLLFTFRALLAATLWLFKKKKWNLRRLAIIGPSNIAHALDRIFWSGYEVVAINPDVSKLQGVEELWIALPLKEQSKAVPILRALEHSTIDIKLMPDFSEIAPLNLGASNIGSLLAIHVQHTPMQGFNRLVKELEDKVLAAMILLLVAPPMAVIALLVKLSSPGPIFYRQERVSWNNEVFSMLKFRTMPVAVEATTGPVWASAQDGRTTFIGKWLRKLNLDELPQFLNVLKGEMSIVGPRPERPHFIEQFKHQIPRYMQKHMVKAGITGLAQIRGFRGQTDLTRRIEYDLQYIREWSLWLDLKIIALTLIRGFTNAY